MWRLPKQESVYHVSDKITSHIHAKSCKNVSTFNACGQLLHILIAPYRHIRSRPSPVCCALFIPYLER
jgi:hypothetical protein